MSRAAIAGALLLAGCTQAVQQPISANPGQDAVSVLEKAKADLGIQPGPLDIGTGLQEAAFNLDGAVAVGITDARIVAAQGCVHGVLGQLGLETGQAPAPSFVPKTSTVLGRGAVLFIRAVQAAGIQGQGVQVPQGCQAIIGQFVLDAAAQGKNSFPGGSLVPALRP